MATGRPGRTRLIHIPYRGVKIPVELPEDRIAFDVSPERHPAVDLKRKLAQVLARPVGAPPLRELVRPGSTVVIIADDNTRLTPVESILPIVLERLNEAGVPDGNITILIASGTHRPMTDTELKDKFGGAILSRISLIQHRYKDARELADCGVTESGIAISVNRHVLDADFRITIGNIIPHAPAGWSGGAKTVLPGVAGEETIAQMHLLGSRFPALGEIDTAMRREMEDFGTKIGLDFILNVVLDADGNVSDAVAGHFIKAHRKGVELSLKLHGLEIPSLADITVSSTSPVDFDFLQGTKGIDAAKPATAKGGEIILVCGCDEGISQSHPDLADYVSVKTNREIWRLIENRHVPDPLTCAEAIVINDTLESYRITVASDGLTKGMCGKMGFRHLLPERLPEYMKERWSRNKTAKIGVLRHSTEVLPILRTGR